MAKKTTKPQGEVGWFGWATITRGDLAQAQLLLESGERGVRDPLGLNAVHRLYADYFFPGTSVQMTRLRYVFFVAAAYEKLRREKGALEPALSKIERWTALQLKQGEASTTGIIGHTIAATRSPVIRPSMSYWTALMQWGIIANFPQSTKPLTRGSIQANWDQYHRMPRRATDEFATSSSLFEEKLEKLWESEKRSLLVDAIGNTRHPLDFELEPSEQKYLKARLGSTGTLLGKLAVADIPGTIRSCKAPWSSKVRALLDESDRDLMQNAMYLAYLVEITRAVYDVLVARIYCTIDRPGNAEARDVLTLTQKRLKHRIALGSLTRRHALRATLTTSTNNSAIGDLPGKLTAFLRRVQLWVESGESQVHSLEPAFFNQERVQKGDAIRMRLHHGEGRQQRAEWAGFIERLEPEPLDYRWPIVQRLLIDLGC